MKYPKTLQNLIECFKRLPGIGEKTAERLALSVLEIDEDTINLFSNSLKDSKTKIRRCVKCNNLSENELCEVCKDKSRNKQVLCVVEEPKNVILFEKLNIFDGYYHVLDGLISPIEGINPENLNLSSLINERINKETKEIIIALNPSIEGEVTSMYIQKILEKKNIKVSRLSYGIPAGSDMEYLDPLMITKALDDRKIISNS